MGSPSILCASALVLLQAHALAQTPCGSEVLLKELSADAPGPVLRTPHGAPVIGGPFSFLVEGAVPNMMGALVFSGFESRFFDPGVGATLHFGLPYEQILFTTDADGCSPVLLSIDPVDASLCGAFAIFQAGVFDVTSVGGLAVTNAIRLRIGDVTRPLFEPTQAALSNGATAVAYDDLDGDGSDDRLEATGDVTVSFGLPGGGYDPTTATFDYLLPSSAASTVADMNGDGDNDLLGITDHSVSVLLLDSGLVGLGSAYFHTGQNPNDHVVADFDLDGALDVAVSRDVGSAVGVLEGTGGGFLLLPTDVPVGAPAIELEAADVDQDGTTDLVVSAGGTVVALGNGDGTFAAAAAVGPAALESLAVLDVDGDLLLDVVGFSGDTVTVQSGVGDGTLLPAVNTIFPEVLSQLAFADLDGDPAFEALGTAQSLFVAEGLGGGSLGNLVEYPTLFGAVSLAAFDADLDGAIDAALVSGARSAVYRGNGDGTLKAPEGFPIGQDPAHLVVADLDGNGLDDVLVSNSTSLDVIAVLSTPSGPVGGGSFALSSFTRALEVGDFDEDGFLDVLLVDGTQDYLRVVPGDGLGGFSAAIDTPVGTSVRDAGVGDFDEDGSLDAAGLEQTAVRFYPGNGDGTFTAGGTVGATLESSFGLDVGHLNTDGHLDLIAFDLRGFVTADWFMVLYFGDGAGGFGSSTKDVSSRISEARVADVNLDGLPDLVTSESGIFFQTSFVVRLGPGFAAGTSIPGGGGVGGSSGFVLGDLDGDAITDLAWAASNNQGAVNIEKGVGDGTFTPIDGTLAGAFPRGIATGDMDGDGNVDLVVTDRLGSSTPRPPGRAWFLINQVGE